MLPKRFRRLLYQGLVTGLLAGGIMRGAMAQQPGGSSTAPSPRMAIWAATADYVYRDDQSLVKIQPQLLKTIQPSSSTAFAHGIDEAVMLENKQLAGQKHLLKFQELFKTIQAQPLGPNDPAALAKAIVAKLDDNKERMADPARAQQLTLLTQRLSHLAAGTAPTVPAAPATPAPVTDDTPKNQGGATPAKVPAPVQAIGPAATPAPMGAPPTSPLLWLALALAGLGLAGVAVLWNKLSNTRQELATSKRVWEVSSKSSGDTFSPAKLTAAVEQEVSRQRERWLAERQAQLPMAEPTPELSAAPEASPPVTAAAPAPRVRTQYVGEAPFNNSFPARSLSDQPGTYSMFAIESSEQQPDQGTFVVTGNLASHVRDHRSVLEPVCEYVGGYPLGSETRVVTEQPGLVRRRGADWEVTQRAKVRFE